MFCRGAHRNTFFEFLLQTFWPSNFLKIVCFFFFFEFRFNLVFFFLQLASVSTVMNQSSIMPFVFRNYSLPCDRQSQYIGSNKYSLYESVRASGAAPTVFQEFCLDGMIHQVSKRVLARFRQVVNKFSNYVIWRRWKQRFACFKILCTCKCVVIRNSIPFSFVNIFTFSISFHLGWWNFGKQSVLGSDSRSEITVAK